MNKQKKKILHTCCLCISVHFTEHAGLHTCYLASVSNLQTENQFTHPENQFTLLLCIGWQFTGREPVYTAVAVTVSISNSQTENQFTHLLLCIGWQLNSQTENQFTHLLPCIGNLQTENQFTHQFPCIGQQFTHKNQLTPLLLCIGWQFRTVYTAAVMYQSATRRQKTSLHICYCVPVNHLQTETSLSICYHASVSSSQKTSLHTYLAVYQSTIYRQTSLSICYYASVSSSQKTSLHICCSLSVSNLQ